MAKPQSFNLLFRSFILVLTAIGATTSMAVASQAGESFVFYIENDSRNIGGPGSDEAYSNGLKFSYLYAKDKVPVWAKSPIDPFSFLFPNQKVSLSKVNFGLSLGHQIYTPYDTDEATEIFTDRPYAAWLYFGFLLSLKQQNTGHFLELDIGSVGPNAYGKEAQNSFHNLFGIKQAEGWGHGLQNEITLQLYYQLRHKIKMSDAFDFINFVGGGLGNVFIGAQVGSMVRFGYRLPDDLGPSRPSANNGDSFLGSQSDMSSNKSYFMFAGVRGNGVVRNIFLDGNSFQKGHQASHSVKKYPLTAETEFGFGTQINPFSIVWSLVTRSPEFESRSILNSFASLNISYFILYP